MSNNKQWLPNKVNGLKNNRNLLPFDGGVISSSGNGKKFQFSSPGLINNKIPDNMWSSGPNSSLFSIDIPSGNDSKWFIVAECSFSIDVTSVVLKLVTSEPKISKPVENMVPSKATIILYHGVETSCWKAVKGNVLVKPMLVIRNFIISPECGKLPFNDYYSFVTIS